ncbi:choice-of-anchor Q domain-containing protein [Frondihabitans australicus]|uniref:Parallel beta helix pectate lyase-like protein n=1 Tax=Frondihabitans australicus TaxID=386892 RepID=A0A495IIQ9_9MICO|nr:choice-of-anchor Q domain-containing protein [Frondihabitans australicus]RKR75874.1 hypothetical protein C8E83_3036 [Frondihabitans australicus]
MKIHRKFTALAAAAAVAAALTGATALGVVAPAQADPLSPQTGARVTTSGNPTAPSGSHVYYVDSTSGSDTNTGLSATSAWKTLARVTSATLNPGDVVAFKRGETFTGSATISAAGTTAKPIVVTAFGSGAQPILTNPGQLNMLVLNAANIQVQNLAFQNGATFTTGLGDTNYENSGAVVVTSNGANDLVQDSTFTSVGLGVKLYGLGSQAMHNTFQNLVIAYNGPDPQGVATSYGAIGVSSDNSNQRIAYNDFINCRSTDSPYGADGGAVEVEGYEFAKNNISIDHNYSRGSEGFIESAETTSSNVTVSYNISDDYQQFIAWDTTTTPTGWLAVNNTVVRTLDNSRLFDQYYYRQAGPSSAANWITIRNNIFVANAWLSIFNFPHDHNLFSSTVGLGSATGSTFAKGPGDLYGDPAFVNESTGDLRLTATSAAIDNGAASTSTTDLFGNPTNVGLGTDIGAAEYQSNPTAGANVVSDGGFESQSTITATTTPWYSVGTHASGVDVNAGKAHTGLNDGWSSTTGTDWGALEQTVPVTANTTYRMTVWVKSSANDDNAWIGADTTSGTVLNQISHGASSTGYTRYLVSFTSGSNTSVVLHVGFYGQGTTTFEEVDDVSLQSI